MAATRLPALVQARATLAKNRGDALRLAQTRGLARTRELLVASQAQLQHRLRRAIAGPGEESFTATQLRATLAQIEAVLKRVTLPALKQNVVTAADDAAEQAAEHTLDYLARADRAFRGVGTQPLALREAAMLEAATDGTRGSILRRLASTGAPTVDPDRPPPRARGGGILERYGAETIGHFETILQRGLVTRASRDDMRKELVEASPFLQQAPAHWATRIVRTEVMGAYNRAGWECLREADDQLGGRMLKILSATFDNRTAADSYAVHGQIRRVDEPFDTWQGPVQHPPARPNDREVVVPHSQDWPIPPYLAWRTDDEVFAVWKRERHKGLPPPRPKLTTVPLDEIGVPRTEPRGSVGADE